MSDKHVMVDIETAGKGPHAHVLTIGLVEFNPHEPDATNDKTLHIVVPEYLNKGRNVDFDTMKWWMEQSAMAQGQAFLAAPDVHAMELFTRFIAGVDHLWANDPDFDCVILKDWMDTNHCVNYKWPYRSHRSLRTLKAMYEIPELQTVGTAHNALDDCRYQIQVVRAVYRGLAAPRYLGGITNV